MWYPDGIVRLYSKVLLDDIRRNNVMGSHVRLGIVQMNEAYRPVPQNLLSTHRKLADFNVKAHRCAYLHKYAPFHTAMVYEMMSRAIFHSPDMVVRIKTFLKDLKICSLGGGPGTELIGVLSALHHHFGSFRSSATIVDIMSDWKETFSLIIKELRLSDYGTLCMQLRYFDWSFVTADLLGEIDGEAREAIERADLVTMVKFVSAAACVDTAFMIEEIFSFMKPGALVFFIDNAGGGFRQLVADSAIKCAFTTVFGPLKWERYTNEDFNIKRFGYVSCHSTTVTVQILMKTVKKKPVRNGRISSFTDINPVQPKNISERPKIPTQFQETRSSALGAKHQAITRIKQARSKREVRETTSEPNILGNSVSQEKKLKYIPDSRPTEHLSSGKQVVRENKSIAKNQVADRSSKVPPFFETRTDEYKCAGDTPNANSKRSHKEMQWKILEEIIRNESSKKNFKLQSSLSATERNIVNEKNGGEPRSVSDNQYQARKFENVSTIPSCNVRVSPHLNPNKGVYKPVLENISDAFNLPHQTNQVQFIPSATRSLQSNSPSVVTYGSILSSSVKDNSSDDCGCSCCVIS